MTLRLTVDRFDVLTRVGYVPHARRGYDRTSRPHDSVGFLDFPLLGPNANRKLDELDTSEQATRYRLLESHFLVGALRGHASTGRAVRARLRLTRTAFCSLRGGFAVGSAKSAWCEWP